MKRKVTVPVGSSGRTTGSSADSNARARRTFQGTFPHTRAADQVGQVSGPRLDTGGTPNSAPNRPGLDHPQAVPVVRIPSGSGPRASWAARMVDGMKQKRRRILRLLARKDGRSSPGELYAELGLSPRTGSRTLNRLRAEGVIAGTKRRVELTSSGWLAARPTPFPSTTPRRMGSPTFVAQQPARPDTSRDWRDAQMNIVQVLDLGITAGLEALSRASQPAPSSPSLRATSVSPRQTGGSREPISAGGWVMLETGQVVWRGRR